MDSMDSGDFAGMTEEQIRALLATANDPAKLQEFQGQKAAADKLRANAFADHPGETVGRQYFPDVGGSLAAGLGAIKGNMDEKKADLATGGIYRAQQMAQEPFVLELLKKLRNRDNPAAADPYGYEGT